MNAQRRQKRVYVAMSGGVDSSVAAALLVKEGYAVTGVFMKPWQAPGFTCQWENDRTDALRVAAHLNIPFFTWDFSREYGDIVAHPLVEGYRLGMTPNPDVECNRAIKFGLFFDRALHEGAEYVATGHYARIVRSKSRPWIVHAKDTQKDQTYFLWRLKSAVLEKTLFPIGGMRKSEVRDTARSLAVPVADKKDSQGVCFIGPIPFHSFLKRSIPSRIGEIRHIDGRIVGTHDGAAYYTIGQRHGLHLTDGRGPYYVVSKDIPQNLIIVGNEEDLYGTEVHLRDVHWFGSQPRLGSRVQVQIRYRSVLVHARVGEHCRFTFERPVKALSPGQSAALYVGERLIGGGIIVSGR